MALPAYGLLIGTPVASRPQSGGHAHWLLMVEPALKNHPPYRVAVNLESTEPGAPPEIEYQVIDVATQGTQKLNELVAQLRALGPTESFRTDAGIPRLDFVRGGLVDPSAFQTVPPGANPLKDAFQTALDAAIRKDETDGGLIAVFGTGYPLKPGAGRSPSTGYTGIDNIHMNQGAPNRVGAGSHYRENGPNQDGGLVFLGKDGSATAVFVKFQSQSVVTDAEGNPLKADHPAIDDHLDHAMAALRADPGVKAALAPVAAAAPPTAFVFADPADDAVEHFDPDVDSHFHTDFVQKIAQGQVRTEVPDPRKDAPVNLNLATVVGEAIPGYTVKDGVQTLAFDLIGDSGAVTASKLQGSMSVGELMSGMARQSQPAFLYHVGDVVYYYGEKQFYYGQFAEVFKTYPAPIFAIPGNHDALTFDSAHVPLESFMAAFCAAKPGVWDGFGGIRRSAMTQPGIYFTLDAPLVSIIGLYSNAGESGGWLNDKQYAFLLGELKRLRPQRKDKERAVILAIHHLPKWFPSQKDPTSAALDAIFNQADLWPDAVVVGHAHLYQRIVRQKGVKGAPADIPYFVNGGGGYGIVATQKSGGAYLETLPDGFATVVTEEGFLRATVAKQPGRLDLTFDYHSAKRGAGAPPADSYKVTI